MVVLQESWVSVTMATRGGLMILLCGKRVKQESQRGLAPGGLEDLAGI